MRALAPCQEADGMVGQGPIASAAQVSHAAGSRAAEASGARECAGVGAPLLVPHLQRRR